MTAGGVFGRTIRRSVIIVLAGLFGLYVPCAHAQTSPTNDYYQRALKKYEKGDFDGAISDLDRFIGELTRNPSAFERVGKSPRSATEEMVFLESGRIVALVPRSAAAYVVRGLAQHAKGEYNLAIEDYDRAIEIAPTYGQAFLDRGAAYHAIGDFGRAIADYTRCLDGDPGNAPAFANRGLALFDRGELQKALADMNTSASLNPNAPATFFNRGNLWFAMKDWARALGDYNHAIELDRKFAVAYNNRGNAHFKRQEWELALADYDRALRLKAGLVEAYLNRGLLKLIEGRRAEAEEDFKYCRMLDKDGSLSMEAKIQSALQQVALQNDSH